MTQNRTRCRWSGRLDTWEAWLAVWVPRILMFFPVVDYGLRLAPITPLGMVWDKCALLALGWVAVRRHRRGLRPPRQAWWFQAVWFLVFVIARAASGASDFNVALAGTGFYIYYLLFAFVLPYAVKPAEVPRLLHLLAGTAVLIGLHAVYQYVIAVPIPADWTDLSQHVRTRVFSVLRSPNELGSYMALMTPLLAGMAIGEKGPWRRAFYGGGSIVCAIAMILTFTRGAWVGLAGALLLSALLFERRLLIPLLGLGAIGFLAPGVHSRVQALFTQVYWMKSADSGRIAKWLSAFDHMSTNPLLGVGVGHYGGAVATAHHFSMYSDNFYAKTLGEVGIVGLILFFAMHLSLLVDLILTVRRADFPARYVFLGATTGILAVLIHNGMENVFEYAPMAMSYFTIATLTMIAGSTVREGQYASSAGKDVPAQERTPIHS
ncbi:MAG: O-antigen ligase family protein [Alicyclobacillus herbarius]|uniref:O-antigen ligase family protein n=1 Tax=Alicyclobacillus herbarius TaxID=122960 RepID=UPI0023569D93|nr:O-antigen ligase family protein [Alicyclobacillus herbarius]MCL6632333.1 O-antigen ligase family protein [Alicyclobacillus herbarius]